MTVAVITDSAAALPLTLVDEANIAVVPMWLHLGSLSVAEGDGRWGEMLGDEHVSTSAPSPGEFRAAIRTRLDGGATGVVVLTIANTMSATYEAARLAAADFGERVMVVDTETAAGAQALVVLAASASARAGASLAQVVERAATVAGRVRLVATVPDLDHLVRSGRVPRVAGRAGRAIGINPLFEFRGGRVRALRPALGIDAALDRIVARFERSRVEGARGHVAVLHALAPERAEALRARVDPGDGSVDAFLGEFGAVMVVHTGPGLVGLAWWWDDIVTAGASSPRHRGGRAT